MALESDDTKILRRNMFICTNERDCQAELMKMRQLRWDIPYMMKTSDLNVTDAFLNTSPALYNIDVLENVACFLTREDLLLCRLVCKLWSMEMGRFLCKRKSLVVVDEYCPRSEGALSRRADGSPIAVSKLCLFDIGTRCPLYKRLFSVFGLTLSSVRVEECQLDPIDLQTILLHNSPNIEHFHLKEVKKLKKANLSTFKQIKTLNGGEFLLPKLKTLYWDEQDCRTELQEIIETCPNLVKLELREFSTPRVAQFKNLTWNSLKSLFLSPRRVVTDHHCKALTHLQLKLEKLTLFGVDSRSKSAMKCLRSFLASISTTLETLELWLDYASVIVDPTSNHYSPFPVFLPKIRTLKTESEILGHLRHTEKLPSLTELEIISDPERRQNWDTLTKRTSMKPHESLQSFRCGDINNSSMVAVMKAFPRITSLRLYATFVTDSFLRAVISNLSCLTELNIRPYVTTHSHTLRLTDSGVTGISKKLCDKFSKNPSDCICLDAVKTKPGLSDLKLLKILDFSLQVSEISDISVLLSISTLSKLCCLKLPRCKITDLSLRMIQERMPSLIMLGIAGCDEISSEAIANLKKHQSNLLVESEWPMGYGEF